MKGISFLIIDDNSVALQELTDILKYLGYKEIHTSGTAFEAWAMLRIKEFNCIISAWEMPEMSGMALLKVVRTDDNYMNLPFYLTDSAFTNSRVIEAGRAGATGLILKPYETETVKSKMDEVAGISVLTEAEVSLEEGTDLIEAGDYEGALKLFEKLIEENESAEVYYNIGYVKTAQGEHEQAIEAFRRATQLDRMFAKAYEAMGRCYKELERPKEAQECLHKAAEIYMGSEKDEHAEEILNEILELRPDTVNVYNSLGVLYRKKGDLQTSLKHYEKALKIHPGEPYIHYNIGRLYVEMNDPETSKSFFKQAVSLDPGLAEARQALHAVELGTV